LLGLRRPRFLLNDCGDTSARQGAVVASKRSHGRITVRRTVLVLAAAAVALLAAAAAMAASHGDSTTRLQALVDADTATARSLMAPDFQVINPAGGVSGREDYMDAVEAGVIDYLVFEPASPIAVRLSGDSAALRYQVSFDLVVGGDTRVTHQGWITELYERRHGRWQIVWEQATAIPNNFGLFVESIKPVS
jgi:Domain of unknown function (DUF4440)